MYTLAPREPSLVSGWSVLNLFNWGSTNLPTGEDSKWFSGELSDPARKCLAGTDPLGIIQLFNQEVRSSERQKMLDLRSIRCVVMTFSVDSLLHLSSRLPFTSYQYTRKKCTDTLEHLKSQGIIFSYEMDPYPLQNVQQWGRVSSDISFLVQA